MAGRRRPSGRRRGAPCPSRSTRCSTASPSPPPSRSGWPRRASSSARSARRCRTTRSWCGSTSARVVPQGDNFYAALNSAVFTDGSFVYIPKGVRCPMELSTYFRINAKSTGQFERTLIIAEEGSHVSYLEGCTAPMRDENQLHAAVVELVALDDADDQVQHGAELVPRRRRGPGRHLQLRHQARRTAAARGPRSAGRRWRPARPSPGSTRPASCMGDDSVGEFYSVAITNNRQQADTGTKMIHIGKQHAKHHRLQGHLRRPRAEHLPRPGEDRADGHERAQLHAVRLLLIGDQCGAHTVPYIENRCMTAKVEHEATTSRIAEDQLFYCRQRGLSRRTRSASSSTASAARC